MFLFKKVLRFFHLYDLIVRYYNNLRLLKKIKLSQELKCRFDGAPDGLPLPSAKLIYTVIGHGWKSEFFYSGLLIFKRMSEVLGDINIKLSDFSSILDFGCGCGRIIRHFRDIHYKYLAGCDYNPNLIKWCQKYLNFGDFRINRLSPPTDFIQNSFDFVFAQSIFTHLNKELQLEWLAEFYRILKPGGILYFTTHGRQFEKDLNPAEVEIYKRGEVLVRQGEDQGKNICSTYQSLAYFKKAIHRGFEIISSVPGLDREHLRQDITILRKTDSELFPRF